MHADAAIHASQLYGFLLVLARMAGVFIFLPLPGFKAGPDAAKIGLALALTFALFSRWPVSQPAPSSMVQLTGWMLAEAGIGLATGLAVSFVIEWLVMAAQAISTQAGFAYASTVDPNTEADSGVLLVFAQLAASMLFFALGLDREILRLFAQSLDRIPAGTYVLGVPAGEAVIRLASGMFSVGVRLALPVVALLVLVDFALALLGRLNQQMQLLALAFPAKMLTALVVLSWVMVLFPRILMQSSGQAWSAARRMLGI